LSAHQHHRLRAFPRRPRHRSAHGEAARVPELHHGLDQRAPCHHQQHPRPRQHRRRRHDAQSRRGGCPQDHGSRRPRGAGPPGQERHHARNPRRAGDWNLHRRRAARAPVAVQSAGQCRGLFARRRGRYLCRSAARGCHRILGDRSRAGHPGRCTGQGVRLVRDPFARLAPPRHGPRPVPGALVRGAARRLGDARIRRRPRHHGHLRLPARTYRRANGGMTLAGHARASGRRGMPLPLPPPAHRSFWWARPEDTAPRRLAIDIANSLQAGDFVTLSGDLGAGKTTLVRTLIRYLAGDAAIEVPSPTFTLMQIYELPQFPLVHADLYRLSGPAALAELGFDDLPEGAVVLLEWPDRADGLLPPDRLDVSLTLAPKLKLEFRHARVTGYGALGPRVDRMARVRQFIAESGYSEALRAPLRGDASTRSYERL